MRYLLILFLLTSCGDRYEQDKLLNAEKEFCSCHKGLKKVERKKGYYKLVCGDNWTLELAGRLPKYYIINSVRQFNNCGDK